MPKKCYAQQSLFLNLDRVLPSLVGIGREPCLLKPDMQHGEILATGTCTLAFFLNQHGAYNPHLYPKKGVCVLLCVSMIMALDPTKSSAQHGLFLNSTCDIGLSDMRNCD